MLYCWIWSDDCRWCWFCYIVRIAHGDISISSVEKSRIRQYRTNLNKKPACKDPPNTKMININIIKHHWYQTHKKSTTMIVPSNRFPHLEYNTSKSCDHPKTSYSSFVYLCSDNQFRQVSPSQCRKQITDQVDEFYRNYISFHVNCLHCCQKLWRMNLLSTFL